MSAPLGQDLGDKLPNLYTGPFSFVIIILAVVSIGKNETNLSNSPATAEPLLKNSPLMEKLQPLFTFFTFESPLQWARSQAWGQDLDPKVAADRDNYLPAYEKEQAAVLDQFHALLHEHEADRPAIIATVLEQGRGELAVAALRAAKKLAVDRLADIMLDLFAVTSHAGRLAIIDYLDQWIKPEHYVSLLQLADRFAADAEDRQYAAGIAGLRENLARQSPAIAWAEAALQSLPYSAALPDIRTAWSVMRSMPDFQQLWLLARTFQAGADHIRRKALYDYLGEIFHAGLTEKGVPDEAFRAGLVVLAWEAQGPLAVTVGDAPRLVHQQSLRKLSEWFHRVGADVRQSIFTALPSGAAAQLSRVGLTSGRVLATRQIMALIPRREELVGDLAPALLELVRSNSEFSLPALLLLRGERVRDSFAAEIGWWVSYFLNKTVQGEDGVGDVFGTTPAREEPDEAKLKPLIQHLLQEELPLTPNLLAVNATLFAALLKYGIPQAPAALARLAAAALAEKTKLNGADLERLQQLLTALPVDDPEMEPLLKIAGTVIAHTALLEPDLVVRHWADFPAPLLQQAFAGINQLARRQGSLYRLHRQAAQSLALPPAEFLPPALAAWEEAGEVLVQTALDHVAGHPAQAEATAALLPETMAPLAGSLVLRLSEAENRGTHAVSGRQLGAVWSELERVAVDMAAAAHSNLVRSYGTDLEQRLQAMAEDLQAALAQAASDEDEEEIAVIDPKTSSLAEILQSWAQQAASQKTKAARAENRLLQMQDRLLGEVGIVMEIMAISSAGTKEAAEIAPVLDRLYEVLATIDIVPIAPWQSTVLYDPLRHRASRKTTKGSLVQVIVPGLMTQAGQIIRVAVCEE